ncbi:TetR family transcriptional regulator [Tsukamurella pulmonis]|uniref:DNA-binding transcriptional regulator YbjK n=1 Tax=Tsukamurella pulmonis TaxID=47312 RepID=A0A1H1FN25_9ACTN|nr:TetR/AcrR family transcriptional regulator [Tsukamurella pulmonis]KXO87935.1 TetR family transcriptional regulator [Tsukamurella pulmonis]SDR02307.1 DNA-binding transcriptional regulator YbjK [Tsukamurella pulmonis]
MPDLPSRSPAAQHRRDLVARSAIGILAQDGVRALTHRAVDASAGLPPGSTSHVARTREALLTLVVDALAESTLVDSGRVATWLDDDSSPLSVEELADHLAGLVETLAARHDDMRARYALIIELHDSPTLHAKLTTGSEVHATARRIATAALRRAGLPHAGSDVDELLGLMESLVFHRSAIDEQSPAHAILHAYLRGRASTRT